MSKPSFILFEDIVEVLRVDDKQFTKGETEACRFFCFPFFSGGSPQIASSKTVERVHSEPPHVVNISIKLTPLSSGPMPLQVGKL
jgi:hypothetical protein